MLPPMMPFLHDAFWFGLFAGLALFAWRAAERYDLRLSSFDLLRRPLGDAAATPSAWFTTKTNTDKARPTRSSGNTAFDDWRDGEIARIEAQRTSLEVRLAAFAAFVDKLKRAKDRTTFERFMAEHCAAAIDVTDAADHPDHRPG